MKNIFAYLLIASLSANAQKDSIVSKWTDTRGAHRDTMVITGRTLSDSSLSLIGSTVTYTLATRIDTLKAILICVDTSDYPFDFLTIDPSDTTYVYTELRGGLYWTRGYYYYSTGEVNSVRVEYLDENKKRLPKNIIVIMSIQR